MANNSWAHYGPRDPQLLTLQSQHISESLVKPDAELNSVFRCRRCDGDFWRLFEDEPPHPHVLKSLLEMGFYGVYRCGRFDADSHFVTALVERWRPETHTFHLPVGEATVTLQDVAMIWGLPIDGKPVTGLDPSAPDSGWIDYCDSFLGYRPSVTDIKNGRIKATSLAAILRDNRVVDHSTPEHIAQYSRACALFLFGGVMCPNATGNLIPLLYLQCFEDMKSVHTWSWGSAVLSCLYRQLCEGSLKMKENLGGPLQLLQIWGWSRISSVLPAVRARRLNLGEIDIPQHLGGGTLPVAPFGARWNIYSDHTHTGRHQVKVFRELFDKLTHNEFTWDPYVGDSPEISSLPSFCFSPIWRSECPLIFFSCVEFHHPERVMRQFRMIQVVPHSVHEDWQNEVHSVDRKGHKNTDWAKFHALYIEKWEQRHELVHTGINSHHPSATPNYNDWYQQVTRRLLSPLHNTDNRGYRTGDSSFIQYMMDRIGPMRTNIMERDRSNIDELNSLLDEQLSLYDNIEQTIQSRGLAPAQTPFVQQLHHDEAQAQVMATLRRRRNYEAGDRDANVPETQMPRPTNYASSSRQPGGSDENVDDVYRPLPMTPGYTPDCSQFLQPHSIPPEYQHMDFDLGMRPSSSAQPYAGGSYYGQVTPIPLHWTGMMSDYRDTHQSTSSSSRMSIPPTMDIPEENESSEQETKSSEQEEEVQDSPDTNVRPQRGRGRGRGRGRYRPRVQQDVDPSVEGGDQRRRGGRPRRAPDCGTGGQY